MNKTIGVCGYIKTGSSTCINLLKEFEDATVLDKKEFDLSFFPDGLEDLEYHLCNYHKYSSSVTAVNRFRKLLKRYKRSTKGNIYKEADNFLNKIIQVSWNGTGEVYKILYSNKNIFFRKNFFRAAKAFRLYFLIKLYIKLFPIKMELSVMPDNFVQEAKQFISNVLNSIKLNSLNANDNTVTILDQPFEGCNPVKSFKYFENPKAIVVDRDPRDHYLFVKTIMRKKGDGYNIPCDSAEQYIEYYKRTHMSPPGLKDNNDILFINYEDLVLNYENTANRIKDFTGLKNHSYKLKYFDPAKAVNNTQLYKKYSKYNDDIKKIEKALPEYIYNFENKK